MRDFLCNDSQRSRNRDIDGTSFFFPSIHMEIAGLDLVRMFHCFKKKKSLSKARYPISFLEAMRLIIEWINWDFVQIGLTSRFISNETF